ncbi:MAG: Gfo/Idh/MocA family oxidoreductase [Acidipropionibacterium acidipropionici]|nr:Gfo/Idh/MocA family oxidoreductase [Acidipropionibacterium acidipropionici]
MIGLATVGTSTITRNLLDAVAEDPRVRHTVVCSRDAARGAAFAARFPTRADSPRVVTTIDDLVAAADVDAVDVASPNIAHHSQALAALAAGKHVLVEKSACVTAASWQQLVDAAGRHGVALLEANRNSTWHPGTAELRDALPRIGRVRMSQLSYCQRSSRYDRFLAGQLPGIFDPRMAAGALMDIGTYPLETMVELFGVPEAFNTDAVRLRNGIDGAGSLLARYDGHLCSVVWSKISDSPGPSVIQGEDGTITVDAVEDPGVIEVRTAGTVRTTRIPPPAGP